MPKPRDLAANSDDGLTGPEFSPLPHSALSALDDRPPEPIDPEHWASVRRGLEQSLRRQYATEAEVEAALAHFDR